MSATTRSGDLRPLSATYRLQLRSGVDFATAASFLPHIAGLGISHLYLSPIFTAAQGSTLGYDITDPTTIDPALGGETGFRALALAAQTLGLGVILDLVPNHTALSLDNPWVRDVLRHGRASAFAGHFDIDWSRRLILPFLPEPLDDMLAAGALRLTDAQGGAVEWEGGWLPLAPGSHAPGDPLPEVLARQSWQLREWSRERGALTHRRFFNVTGLIGMRVEDPEVFEAMTALPARLVAEGLAQGLRIDHVDGLADPAAYLDRLRATVGPEVPIWVEKILTGDEALPPAWPVAGTTGYEAGRQICRLLTPPAGLAALDRLWQARTGGRAPYATLCREARAQVIPEDLAAELRQLIGLAQAALAVDRLDPPDAETLREAMLALLIAFPRYRSYLTVPPAAAPDRALIETAVAEAAKTLPNTEALDLMAALLLEAEGVPAADFRTRFQQVTGAVVAKAQEDTAFFRHSRYLAANEVGAEPDAATLDTAGLNAWLDSPQGARARALTLTSSHDTKRSEDTRMRITAISHRPDLFATLHAAATAAAPGADPSLTWYAAQSLLGIWNDPVPSGPDIATRLADHLRKALREGGEVSRWSYPDTAAEDRAIAAALRIHAVWEAACPPALSSLIALGRRLSLLQLALKAVLPGIPDFYQRAERGLFELTDPDNRRPFALPGDDLPPFDRLKTATTTRLLDLRAAAPDFFREAPTRADETGGRFTLARTDGNRHLSLHLRRDASPLAPGTLFEIALSGDWPKPDRLTFPPASDR
ncbi:malto-oligosyltrehalose synthase [Acidimangrovimonas sediminis]|uniref:malto-oligosyltrehalose synthase n=1 Tax=Acidimangrovimonas sediminis TaxID=2056283 RepID=UPI000C805945|nr:malto-oligosyltrehalose synthase [Acidimangrovimonas sediminis]